MSKKFQARPSRISDDSSDSEQEHTLGLNISGSEASRSTSDLGSLLDGINSVGIHSDQAIGSIGRSSNASSGLPSVATPQRERRRRRLEVETGAHDIPSGRSAPINLPLDDTNVFSPLNRRRSEENPLSGFPSIANMSESSGSGIERSISRDQFYENTMREKKQGQKWKEEGAAGAGDESDFGSELSFDGDTDEGLVDELEAETCPWIYDTDKDYQNFLQDCLNIYINLRDRPDLQEKILDHLNLLTMKIPQADQERVKQLEQTRTYLQGLQSGMLTYPGEQEHPSIGSKRKRSGGKRKTRKSTKRRKVTKRRKTIKRKPRKKTYKKKRQTKRRSTRRRR